MKQLSGKEALIALANGDEVEYYDEKLGEWVFMDMRTHFERSFRLKLKTITINGIEVPAPFEPKEGERYYYLCGYNNGYDCLKLRSSDPVIIGAWRTEDEIKQVVAALRSVFNGESK